MGNSPGKRLRVKGWDEWQSYRKDRGAPPWIKVHRAVLTNAKWASLSDAEKGQIVSIWLVAAGEKGVVPNDAAILRKICGLDEKPDLEKFINLGLLEISAADGCQDDVKLASSGCQHDRPETETETETEKEKEKDSSDLPGGKSPPCPHLKIVELYNEALPELTRVKVNLWNGPRKKHLAARWKEDPERQDLQWWADYFRSVKNSPFLIGENDRGWTADLAWLLKPMNMTKVLEGKYAGQKPKQPDRSHLFRGAK